jgi:hypothetical protein
MRKFPASGKFKITLGVIAVAIPAAVAAPAFAADPQSGSYPFLSDVFCYKNADSQNNGDRYFLSEANGFVDYWDNYPGTPPGYRGLGYRAYVVHQNWDGSQYVADNDWNGSWGGSSNYVPITPDYWRITDICRNLTGYSNAAHP